MQALYQCEATGKTVAESFQDLRDNFQANKKAVPYALEIMAGVTADLAEIDRLIAEHSKNWRLERMALVDRNILRVAAYEFLRQQPEVPPSVVINEALEVAARYSDEDSAPFINGVLDSMRKALGLE
jgi:N utilization substance protein B